MAKNGKAVAEKCEVTGCQEVADERTLGEDNFFLCPEHYYLFYNQEHRVYEKEPKKVLADKLMKGGFA